MKRLILLSVVVAVAVILCGCTTVQKGAAVGGVAGAAVGGVWAHHGGVLSTAEGAFTGAAAGGLVGALVGDQLSEHVEENLEAEIENLRNQIQVLEDDLKNRKLASGKIREKDDVIDGLKRLTDKQSSDLESLRDQLVQKENELARIRGMREQQERNLEELKNQLDDLQVELAKTPKGLTLTMVDSLLFKPGLAEISDDGKTLLDNVSVILQERFPGHELIFEGHTDNQPINVSGWKSNWELGSARALAVLHYLVNNHNFDPKRLSATTFGEYSPVATNETEDGRAQNRRAVIVVPSSIEVIHKPIED